jgi:hypothetical protein
MTAAVRRLAIGLAVFALGCGGDGGSLDSTPGKLDGSESHEFEQEEAGLRVARHRRRPA